MLQPRVIVDYACTTKVWTFQGEFKLLWLAKHKETCVLCAHTFNIILKVGI